MGKYFYIMISAIIAVSFYILIILLFVLYLQKPVIKKYQSKSSDTIIELEIILNKVDIKKKYIKKIVENVIKKEIEIKKSSSVSATKKTNLKSLFAKVSTKSIKIKEKNALNVKNNTVSSRFKSKLKEEKTRTKLKIKNTTIENKKRKIHITKTNEEFDEYYSKLNHIILSRWYNYPLFVNDNYLVKVEITINSQGIFSYNIMSNSGNKNVDAAVKDFLQAQTSKEYPQTNNKKIKKVLIIFKNEKD